jgi:hypothetical protein
LKCAGKTNGVISLDCDRYSLEQEGCFSRIRCGGGIIIIIISNISIITLFETIGSKVKTE